jgi:hypothetical protein
LPEATRIAKTGSSRSLGIASHRGMHAGLHIKIRAIILPNAPALVCDAAIHY